MVLCQWPLATRGTVILLLPKLWFLFGLIGELEKAISPEQEAMELEKNVLTVSS